MKPKRTRAICAIAPVAAACAAGLALLAYRRYRNTYATFDTMFGRARVYQVEDDDGSTVRLLEVGGIVQSGTYVDERYSQLVFEYLKRYDAMFDVARPVRDVCVLGCGGYDYPEHLIANHPHTFVDAVEIDPAITAIAGQYFFLDRIREEYATDENGRLRLFNDDALAFLQNAGPAAGDTRDGAGSAQGPKLYDAIVNDTFDAGTPPAHLTTPAFARAVHARLAEGGLYLTNIVSALEGPRSAFLHEQIALLENEFAHVRAYPCATDSLTEPDNVIVIASDGALPE